MTDEHKHGSHTAPTKPKLLCTVDHGAHLAARPLVRVGFQGFRVTVFKVKRVYLGSQPCHENTGTLVLPAAVLLVPTRQLLLPVREGLLLCCGIGTAPESAALDPARARRPGPAGPCQPGASGSTLPSHMTSHLTGYLTGI